MTIIKRTCATCAAFNPSATDDDEVCGNLTFFTLHQVDAKGKLLTIHQVPGLADRCDSHQTQEEDDAETLEIEMSRHLAQATPEFMNASRSCLELRATLGEDHPETQKAVELAMSLAPQSLTEYLATKKAAADEVARQVAEATPEFMAAMSACLRLVESLGMDHPDTIRAMQRAMALAGPSMNAFMADKVRELDLIPEADGYLDDGQPVYSLESIAAKLDMSMDEAKAAMDDMLEDRAALELPAALVDPSKVHRKH